MVSNTSTNKAPRKKAAPATVKRGGKAVAAETAHGTAKRVTKKTADDVVNKLVKKKANEGVKLAGPKKAHDVAKEGQKKAHDMAKKEGQQKADGMVKKAAVGAKKKPMVAAASFKAATTVDDMAKKAATAAANRVGKAMVAASYKAAATVFEVANRGYTLQMSDRTCTGAHCSHHLSRDILPAKEKRREKDENTEEPGLIQCKVSSAEGKHNHSRWKIPVAPIAEFNFLGLPIRPGEKDCSYYMRNGSCKYESNCRFNHPDPTVMEGGDAPSVCGNDGSCASQGAFEPPVFSLLPPRTANDTVPFVPVVFSPTHNVPLSNVEWDDYQNTTTMETPLPHSFLTPTVVTPSPTTAVSSPPSFSTTIEARVSGSPASADGMALMSPILGEEDDPKFVKARRYRILCEKMVKLCARSCESKAAFEFVDTTVDFMCAEVDKMFLEEGDSIDKGVEQLVVVDPKSLQVNGLKKRVNLRRVRHRLRKKVVSKPSHHGQATRA